MVNSSATDAADAVVLTDPIPAEVTYVSGSITLDGVAQGDVSGDGDPSDYGSTAPGTLTVNIGTLAAGATAVVTFEVTVN